MRHISKIKQSDTAETTDLQAEQQSVVDLADNSTNTCTTLESVVATTTPLDSEPAKQESALAEVDPTRYGDWEKNGRCIDF